jgi:hypothetical protein
VDVNVQVGRGVRVAAAGTATWNDVKIQPSKTSSVPDGGVVVGSEVVADGSVKEEDQKMADGDTTDA